MRWVQSLAVAVALAAKPKAMEFTGTEVFNKLNTFPTIDQLDGDALKICYDLSGKARPTEFKTAEGTRLFLVTYEREKK